MGVERSSAQETQPLLTVRTDDASLAARDEEKKAALPVRPLRIVASAKFLRWLAIAAVCALYMVVSSGLIVLNKYLLTVDGFRYPLLLSSLGMAFSGVAGFLICKVFRLVEAKRTVSLRFYLTRIMPIGLFMALTLFCGNLVYLYLTVSFIQMLKAFCPIITMGALFIAGLDHPSSRLISSVCMIAFGTAVASYGEVNKSYLGLFIMFSSETFESIRLVMTQVLLVGLNFHPIEGLMYLAPACVLWGAVGVWLLEWPLIKADNGLALMAAKPMLYCLAAALGFGVNVLAFVVIQLASSLTLKVLGTVKNTVVVMAGIVLFRETVRWLQGGGYTISLLGFALYNMQVAARAAAKSPKQRSLGAEAGRATAMAQPTPLSSGAVSKLMKRVPSEQFVVLEAGPDGSTAPPNKHTD